MLKISLNYMLNRALSMSVFASWCGVLFWINMSLVSNGLYKNLIIMIFTMLFVMLGSISPKLPEAVFVMPVSKTVREHYIKKLFIGKLILAGGLETILSVVAIVLGVGTPLSMVLSVANTVIVAYGFVVTGYYQGKNVAEQSRIIVGISGVIIMMVITIGSPITPGIPALVIGLILLVLWCLVLYKPVTTTNRMCADLADYEKLTVTNMPLDKRAKLKEKGAI